MARSRVFQSYKPLRNFLRGFNLWSGLGTVYCYMQFLQFDRALPDSLKNNALRMGMSNFEAGLHGHLLELLARELVINAQTHGGESLTAAPMAFKAMRMIHDLDNESWGQHGSRSSDIMLHLSRLAFKQFPWQSPLTNGVLARYQMLYGHSLVAPMVEAEFGMSMNELFQLVLLLTEELMRRPTLAFEFLSGADRTIHDPVLALSDRVSRSSKELRALMLERQTFDVNWAYSYNALRGFPIIHAGNPRSVMCPVPLFLIQRLTDGLFFDLMRSDRGFGNAIGKAFEAYVGAVAANIGDGKFDLLEERRWGKPERRSADWLIADASATMFVECKFGRLDIASQTEIVSDPPLIAAIDRLAGNVGQLYATLTAAIAGDYPHWKPDSRPIHPIVVTFNEWFVFGPFFYGHLDSLVDAEFTKRDLDRALLERWPYTVCSISEFEGLLTACRDDSIDRVLSLKTAPEHRQSLLRGFLADRFPGSLSNALGTFEKGMDVVIDGPSRFTRS